ncbi:MAG: M24 family metallopeptidase [Spirochaetaceae bacterium]|nr:MAG: M24 family metallopeptidase [Spirochaetaceae bacterium]
MESQVDAARLRTDFGKVLSVLEQTPSVDKTLAVERQEFEARSRQVYAELAARDIDLGLVFSDEHYCGDVPYLGGNTNITVEQVCGVVGRTGFHLIAGLEGGYVAEQLAARSGATVHKAELLQLADEEYPVAAEPLEDILCTANGGQPPGRIGLLTPRQVIPASLVEYVSQLVGTENLVDAQEVYYRIKYEKSEREMELISQAACIADAVMEAMLRVIRPGVLETQVAAWGYFVARELGAEELGFDVIVGANEANRALIGKALNRPIHEGDYVNLGVGTKRDGLNACIRRSVIAAAAPAAVTEEQRFWFDLVEEGYRVGYDAYCTVARDQLPARLQEQALVDYFASRSQEVSARVGREIRLEELKPYTGTHNSGYTECQEFFGAITLDSHEPLGNRIVTMLDVALRGIGNHWNDVRLPGLDYLVVENTLGKYGTRVETLTSLPLNVQPYVSF